MKLKIYLLLLFSLITSIFFSQKIDLDAYHIEKMIFHRNTDIDSLFFHSKKLENSTDLCSKIKGISGRFYGLYRQKKYYESEKLVKQVITTIDSINKKTICFIHLKKSALNRLFWIKKNQEKYDEAYSILIKFERMVLNSSYNNNKKVRDNLGLILNKATIKNKLNLPEDALKILRGAYSKINSPVTKNLKKDSYFKQWKANILNCLGNTFIKLNAKTHQSRYLDSASHYFNKSFQTTKTFVPLHKDSEIFYSFRKTEVLIAQKKYNEAINETNKYSKISNGYHYKHREFFQKAICYYNLKIADSSIYYANKIINDKKEKCRRSKLITMYSILSNEYNRLQKIDSAYKYSQLNLEQYTLARVDKEKTFNSLYKNDYEKAQQLNIEIKKREEQKQRNLIIAFIGLLSALIVIVIFMLKTEKKKKNTLIDIIKDHKPIEVEKKEYNIDEELENKILAEIKRVNTSLYFLKPDFSISTIADKLKTNSTYVSFVFNKYNDESFKQYYTRLKIEYIVKQLKTNKTYRKYSIQALAEELGYTNASAFTRAFKKQMGITPSVFLKSLDE